ncbi:hypothetical protein, partial [Amycolatopsis circi]|uniref:hypothetical protein n=1 Tax=Amycolatopsis circi TaxID=871959 RepID=UPI001ABFA8ED
MPIRWWMVPLEMLGASSLALDVGRLGLIGRSLVKQVVVAGTRLDSLAMQPEDALARSQGEPDVGESRVGGSPSL